MRFYLSSIVFLWMLSGVCAQAQNGSASPSSPNMNLDISRTPRIYVDPLSQALMTPGFRLATVDEETYRLGSGDILSIEFLGSITFLARGISVNPVGDIVIPEVGTISVANLTLAEAKLRVESQAEKRFKDTRVVMSLEYPRSFEVSISGSVTFPGTYESQGFNRLLDLVFAAEFGQVADLPDQQEIKKPLDIAKQEIAKVLTASVDLRNVVLIRDSTQMSFDLMAFLLSTEKTQNPYLLPGDRVRIQSNTYYNKRISISGAVRRPVDLVFRDGDTISGLVALASGLSDDADVSKAFLYVPSVSGIQQVEVPRSDWDSRPLAPNTRVVIPFDQELRANGVITVRGEVARPGRLPIVNGQTSVAQMLDLVGGTTQRALLSGAYILRGNNSGRVASRVPQAELMLKRGSDQYIQGLEYLELESQVNTNRIYLDLENQSQLQNTVLVDGDVLVVPFNEASIKVFGQVNRPGIYAYDRTHSAMDYVRQAGGYSIAADNERVFVIKASTQAWLKPGNAKLEPGDQIFVDRVPYEDLNLKRTYKNQRIQIWLAAVTTLTSVLTTYVAIRNL